MIDAARPDVIDDRRRDRTRNALDALTRLVEASRRRSGVEAVTVSDPSGLLLAGSGAHRLCEELAAWAPVMARGADNDTVPSSLDSFEGRMRLRRLSIDGLEMVVTFCGARDEHSSELEAVSAGCTRILREGNSP
ncbi:MAG TPA: hypothetical protein VGQ57_18375 [Polyangiaceae bacterium]|jgi:hypothetical protein|nr:hypothetical protein [Polyangiaceae bacterium]